jgi:hypothetical protein
MPIKDERDEFKRKVGNDIRELILLNHNLFFFCYAVSPEDDRADDRHRDGRGRNERHHLEIDRVLHQNQNWILR